MIGGIHPVKMDKTDTDSLDSVTTKDVPGLTLTPTYSITSEPPPAYQKNSSNSVRIARVIAVAVVLVALVLGVAIVLAAYLQSRNVKQVENHLETSSHSTKQGMTSALIADIPESSAESAEQLDSKETDHRKLDNDIDVLEELLENGTKIPVLSKDASDLNIEQLTEMIMGENLVGNVKCFVEKHQMGDEKEDKKDQEKKVNSTTTKDGVIRVTAQKVSVICHSDVGEDSKSFGLPSSMILKGGPVPLPFPFMSPIPIIVQEPMNPVPFANPVPPSLPRFLVPPELERPLPISSVPGRGHPIHIPDGPFIPRRPHGPVNIAERRNFPPQFLPGPPVHFPFNPLPSPVRTPFNIPNGHPQSFGNKPERPLPSRREDLPFQPLVPPPFNTALPPPQVSFPRRGAGNFFGIPDGPIHRQQRLLDIPDRSTPFFNGPPRPANPPPVNLLRPPMQTHAAEAPIPLGRPMTNTGLPNVGDFPVPNGERGLKNPTHPFQNVARPIALPFPLPRDGPVNSIPLPKEPSLHLPLNIPFARIEPLPAHSEPVDLKNAPKSERRIEAPSLFERILGSLISTRANQGSSVLSPPKQERVPVNAPLPVPVKKQPEQQPLPVNGRNAAAARSLQLPLVPPKVQAVPVPVILPPNDPSDSAEHTPEHLIARPVIPQERNGRFHFIQPRSLQED